MQGHRCGLRLRCRAAVGCCSTTARLVTYGAAAFDASGLRLLRSGQRVTIRVGPDGTVEAMGLPGLPLQERPE